MFLKNEKTMRVTITSCNNEKIVPSEYLQSRKRMKIYKAITNTDQNVAHFAPVFKSSEMVGSTLFVCCINWVANCSLVTFAGSNGFKPVKRVLRTSESVTSPSW